MAANSYPRRQVLQMLAATAANAGGLAAAKAATREAVIEAAKAESGLVWYDHYDGGAAEGVLDAFRRAHSFVKKVEFIDVPSAQKTAKVIQESTAGGPTADVLLNGTSVQNPCSIAAFCWRPTGPRWALRSRRSSPRVPP